MSTHSHPDDDRRFFLSVAFMLAVIAVLFVGGVVVASCPRVP